MLASSKRLPLCFIGLGALLVIAAVSLPMILKPRTDGPSIQVPQQVSHLSLGSEVTGSAALSEFARLHGKTFPVLSGVKASYGSGSQISLWVAGTASPEDAYQLLKAMRDKIAEGRSPFQPTGMQNMANREVYTLDGMGQKHFYFQSGKNLVWLAANAEFADQALQQALDFYP